MSTTVLVTGATGKVGRRLIPLLARRGVSVRTASRSPLPQRAGIEPVHFDWTDETTYEAARKGVGAMYLVAGPVPQSAHADYIGALLDDACDSGSCAVSPLPHRRRGRAHHLGHCAVRHTAGRHPRRTTHRADLSCGRDIRQGLAADPSAPYRHMMSDHLPNRLTGFVARGDHLSRLFGSDL